MSRSANVPVNRRQNKLESDYDAVLYVRQLAGEVLSYRYESIKLRLADNTHYTPDFAVEMADGTIEMHECKGFMRDDANVKLKVAAQLFPWFRFRLITRSGRCGWEIKEVLPS